MKESSASRSVDCRLPTPVLETHCLMCFSTLKQGLVHKLISGTLN